MILHEYGHALSGCAAPGTNTGEERRSLDEALGDYLAGSYSKSVSTYHWGDVYSWDGHNEFWAGRKVISVKHYTDKEGNLYLDAPIWSSTIMQIWDDIGRSKADEIMLQSLFDWAPNMNMPQAATAYIQADSALYNGDHYNHICARMNARGLHGNCIVGTEEYKVSDLFALTRTAQFANGDAAMLSLAMPMNVNLTLYDVTGRVVA